MKIHLTLLNTMTQSEEMARQDFIAGQMDAINSIAPQSDNYYYRMGWEDATYEISLGRVQWHLNEEKQEPEPINI